MKALALAVFLALAAALPCAARTAAPLEIAGLRLGTDIGAASGKVNSAKVEVELPERYLSTVTVKPVEGFRSGYVTYGNCASPGRILRIKMNYDDPSREFHEKLLKALAKRYGEPTQWRGNPFGTLRIWKWKLTDTDLGDISLILQYYKGDDDSFTKGNSIRISAPDMLDKESACYRASHPEPARKTGPAPSPKEDLNAYLPH